VWSADFIIEVTKEADGWKLRLYSASSANKPVPLNQHADISGVSSYVHPSEIRSFVTAVDALNMARKWGKRILNSGFTLVDVVNSVTKDCLSFSPSSFEQDKNKSKSYGQGNRRRKVPLGEK